MGKILVLEDMPDRIKAFRTGLIGYDVDFAETSKQAIEFLKQNTYDLVFLDHDLGGKVFVPSGENTGYEVACFIAENPQRVVGDVIVHSSNPAGVKNIKMAIPKAKAVPFAWMRLEELLGGPDARRF